MADSRNNEQEPSIEEILTSIRQIISDDDEDEAPKAKPAPAPAPEPEPEIEDDIIELTERVDDDSDPFEDDAPEYDPVIEMKDAPLPSASFDAEEEAGAGEEEDDFSDILASVTGDDFAFTPDSDDEDDVVDDDFGAPADSGDSILTQRAEAAAYSGFKKLAAKTALDTITGVTIEEIVRDELRPMLRVWLDENLPDIVERLVKDELDKVARRALED